MYTFLKNHYHTRYHGVYQHAKKLFIFDLALLGLALVMMVYLFALAYAASFITYRVALALGG